MLFGLETAAHSQQATLVESEGRVVVTKQNAKPVPAEVGIGLVARDRLGTGESSRAVLRLSERWLARVDEDTDVEITPGALAAKTQEELKVSLGGAFIYSREEEGELKVQTPSATGGLRGTQLVVRVLPNGKTLMQVLEGEVDLANEQGRVVLKAGEAGEAERGKAPRKTAVIDARNLLQWALYYPGVLQPEELGLTGAEQRAAAASLQAYRDGDLLGALARYPAGYAPASNGGRLYRAAVLLATGRVEEARRAMAGVPPTTPGRRALERMIAGVKFIEQPDYGELPTAGEALAESYYQQSRSQLEAARTAARRATELAPNSGYAWTRLAELEFSFGRTHQARLALDRGLKLAPQNAQAHALRGFVLAAEGDVGQAQAEFQQATQLDGGLANGWLGLGLTKIKRGQSGPGAADLQTAATVEPLRSFLYSYHGKALSNVGKDRLAHKDLALAGQIDPKDPTPPLYSALLDEQENRTNRAISEMEQSLDLNDNRRVYRSQFLLDQDRAVRNANLAKIYQNDGMTDLAVREATRAVDADYTNASAHLFLANSFDALRDPQRVSLRYETAWFNELLLANLLSPVGGGALSQYVSQQEYSKLLEADGVGASLSSEYRSSGYVDERASVFGTFGRLSFGLDYSYHYDAGNRPNEANTIQEGYWQLKYQVSPDDVFYTLGSWQQQDTGDLFQSYNNAPGNPGLSFNEKQEPGLQLFGWNHQWAPGSTTLVLVGRLAADQVLTAPNTNQLLLGRDSHFLSSDFPGAAGIGSNPDGSLALSDAFSGSIAPFLVRGPVTSTFGDTFDFATERKFEIYSGEIQHIWQTPRNTLIVGGRWLSGKFDTSAELDLVGSTDRALFTSPASRQSFSVDFDRESVYGYDYFRVAKWLTLIAGASWDHTERPENFRNPPLSDQQVVNERTSGKFGFTLAASRWLTLRGVCTEGVGGVTFDESVRLEPVQLAGFNQAYRTVISESIAGSVEGPVYKNWGLSAEGQLPARAWWGVSFNVLTEDVDRTVGDFDFFTSSIFPAGEAALPSGTDEKLAYREQVLTANVNKLLGEEFAVGLGYRYTHAELHDTFPQIPIAVNAGADRSDEAALHEFTAYANWNSPSGLFARVEANWYAQDIDGTLGGAPVNGLPGDDFWQFNAELGYRFHRHLCDVSIGVLNIGDTDYRLTPLTYYTELPRERTFFVRCRLSF